MKGVCGLRWGVSGWCGGEQFGGVQLKGVVKPSALWRLDSEQCAKVGSVTTSALRRLHTHFGGCLFVIQCTPSVGSIQYAQCTHSLLVHCLRQLRCCCLLLAAPMHTPTNAAT